MSKLKQQKIGLALGSGGAKATEETNPFKKTKLCLALLSLH